MEHCAEFLLVLIADNGSLFCRLLLSLIRFPCHSFTETLWFSELDAGSTDAGVDF